MKISFSKLFFLLILLLVVPFLTSQAQTLTSDSSLSISMSPQNPSPGDRVTVSLQSFSSDLNRAKITWLVNGVEKRSEIGLKNYYIQAGTAGTSMTISSRIETLDGNMFSREVTFIPAGVDLIFETISYVPPFYKGKAMNTNQGTIVVVAFPEMFDQNGRKFTTKELVYAWRKNDVAMPSASGVGKNYLTFSGSVPVRDAKIEVAVSSLDQSIVANKTINIGSEDPKIVFYENSPIYGIMTNKAIKNTVQLLSDEFSVLAIPYFFGVGYSTTPDLDYVWTINGRTAAIQEPKNSFTVRQENPGAGTANIALKINNNVRIFQFANSDFIINFQK